MTATGHLLFSLSCLILIRKLINITEFLHGDWIHLLVGVLFGSLLPDIDHPSSHIGRLFRFISVPICRLCGHRGFTHSLCAWVVIILLSNKLKNNYLFSDALIQSFLLGYFSHLIADMLTAKGIPFLWPSKINFCFPILKSSKKDFNKKREYTISILLAICAILIPHNCQLQLDFFFNELKNFLHIFYLI
ncbi:Inner membrane protein YdjM [Candidatus Arsenophonus lipoptenae]|uniref:Inner membrane protein YdjM n=1 Tax=Candidatus Arsenophonus lipoptenae TaxID=634113 RepID=A0A120HPU4_9GAMM|nr:metal-dependent hydrolase [Candidatus Arsenophonus lipoptenae]AMA64828.1 Inner membrane protein YdjM [Candidatus Arsenophonus lipoptenae]